MNKTENLKIELCKKIVKDSFEEVSFTERDNKEFWIDNVARWLASKLDDYVIVKKEDIYK